MNIGLCPGVEMVVDGVPGGFIEYLQLGCKPHKGFKCNHIQSVTGAKLSEAVRPGLLSRGSRVRVAAGAPIKRPFSVFYGDDRAG